MVRAIKYMCGFTRQTNGGSLPSVAIATLISKPKITRPPDLLPYQDKEEGHPVGDRCSYIWVESRFVVTRINGTSRIRSGSGGRAFLPNHFHQPLSLVLKGPWLCLESFGLFGAAASLSPFCGYIPYTSQIFPSTGSLKLKQQICFS